MPLDALTMTVNAGTMHKDSEERNDESANGRRPPQDR